MLLTAHHFTGRAAAAAAHRPQEQRRETAELAGVAEEEMELAAQTPAQAVGLH